MNQSQISSNCNSEIYNPHQQYVQRKGEKKKQSVKKGQIRGKKKKEQQNYSDNSFISENDYKVDKIKGKRVKHGVIQYLVSWVGYEGQDTWEDAKNLKYLKEDMDQFQEKIRLSEIEKAAKRFSVLSQYQYDFSRWGKNLIMINQNENIKSSSAQCPQNSFHGVKNEDMSLSYVSSNISLQVASLSKEKSLIQNLLKLQNSTVQGNIHNNSTIANQEGSINQTNRSSNDHKVQYKRSANNFLSKFLRFHSPQKPVEIKPYYQSFLNFDSSLSSVHQNLEKSTGSITILKPCSTLKKIYRSQVKLQ